MDSTRLHGRQRIDGARKFALERAQIVYLLRKFANAERSFLKYLEADSAPSRHALAGELQTRRIDDSSWYFDRRTATRNNIRDLRCLQFLHDGCAILGREIGEKRRVVYAVVNSMDCISEAQKERHANEQQALLPRRKKAKETPERLLKVIEKIDQLFRHV